LIWIWNWSGKRLTNAVWLLAVKLPEHDASFDLDVLEAQALIEACGFVCERVVIQQLKQPSPMYVQKGKLHELKAELEQAAVATLITHAALSPAQHRNLSVALQREVLDRTQLILEIFATRALSKESKLQVEHARLTYLLPRTKLSHGSTGRQQGGAVRTRGAGEQALALRQRVLERDLQKITRQLKTLHRSSQRSIDQRTRHAQFTVALLGYTNAGKSTLMNQWVQHYGVAKHKTVSAKDRVFESLQTAARELQVDGRSMVLLDTVGFIQAMPKALDQAFQSTLSHIQAADVLIHVIDASHPAFLKHEASVDATLRSLGVLDKVQLRVMNKVDQNPNVQGISALHGTGLDALMDELCRHYDAQRPSIVLELPYDAPLSLDALKAHYALTLIHSSPQVYRLRLHEVRTCPDALRVYHVA
jgi:GTP-binding protein HflX